MLDRLKNVIIGVAATVALIPGAGLLIGGLELPAQFDKLLGTMAAIVGPLVFFVVYLTRPWIERQPRWLLISVITVLGMGGLVLGFFANAYASNRMGEYRYMEGEKEINQGYIIPEKYSDDLRQLLARDGNNFSNALKRDRENMLRLIERDSFSVRAKIVLGFLLAQTMLIIAFLFAAWAVTRLESLAQPDED